MSINDSYNEEAIVEAIALQIGERLSSFLTGFDKDIMADRTVK